MKRLMLVLVSILPLCAAGNPGWACRQADGSRVFQDYPCGQVAPAVEGVVHAPAPRADSSNPGWCAAHRAWRDEAREKSGSANEKDTAASWHARELQNEQWLKAHHCQDLS